MTKDQAEKRILEWKAIEATEVWEDLVEGLIKLHAVHDMVVHKSGDPTKIYRSQGACDICNVVLKAKDNQLKEAKDAIEGKRPTGHPARYS